MLIGAYRPPFPFQKKRDRFGVPTVRMPGLQTGIRRVPFNALAQTFLPDNRKHVPCKGHMIEYTGQPPQPRPAYPHALYVALTLGWRSSLPTKKPAVVSFSMWERHACGGITSSREARSLSRGCPESLIPHPKAIEQGAVQEFNTDLQQVVRTRWTAAHLLLLAHPVIDQMVHDRFDMRRGNAASGRP
jgi:hypothetical protein